VKQLYRTFFSGQGWVFQQDSVLAQNPRQLRSGCGGTFRPLSVPRIGPRGVQTLNPRTTNCGLFGGHSLPKASQQPGQPEEIPLEKVRATTAEWLEHLKACVKAEGSHFEWHYYK